MWSRRLRPCHGCRPHDLWSVRRVRTDTAGRRSRCDRRPKLGSCARIRPERSDSPTAENGTMKVIGLEGYCATTGSAKRARIPAAAENRTGLRMASLMSERVLQLVRVKVRLGTEHRSLRLR